MCSILLSIVCKSQFQFQNRSEIGLTHILQLWYNRVVRFPVVLLRLLDLFWLAFQKAAEQADILDRDPMRTDLVTDDGARALCLQPNAGERQAGDQRQPGQVVSVTGQAHGDTT